MQGNTVAAFTVLALLGLPACGQGTDNHVTTKKDATVVASAANPKATVPQPAAATDDPDYEIGPGDVLNINVWREPDVSGTVPVRPDGKISLPLLSDVTAAGTTPSKLAVAITDRLRQYLNDPRVTVIVTAANSRRVFLIGEVMRPGSIPMLPNMTVLQALSASGGFNQFANIKKMYLLRTENGKQVKIPVNYKGILSGNAPEQNAVLKPGDTIVVP